MLAVSSFRTRSGHTFVGGLTNPCGPGVEIVYPVIVNLPALQEGSNQPPKTDEAVI